MSLYSSSVSASYLRQSFLRSVVTNQYLSYNILDSGQMCYRVSNGYIGEFFVNERRIRQGCPLSAILYVLYAEALGTLIRKEPTIHGIQIPGSGEPAKISQYADDTTFFISMRTSIAQLFLTLTRFEKATGSKIKASKTKGMCLGGGGHPTPKPRPRSFGGIILD